MKSRHISLLTAGSLLLLVQSAPALVIRVYNAATHSRFTNFPAAPQINPTFLGGTALSYTGVGWSDQDTNRQFTLVTPRHFVGANHYRPVVGAQVVFLGPDNVVRAYTIAQLSGVPNDDGSASDLFLGELAQDIPTSTGIRPMAYLNLLSEGAYVGKSLIIFGRTVRGGRGVINSVTDFGGEPVTAGAGVKTRAYGFTYNTAAGGADDAHCEAGDSGSPAFVLDSNNKPALVGTHTAILNAVGTVTSYDTLVPHYAPVVNPLLEITGYHMIKSAPPATTLSAVWNVTGPVRALKPFTATLTLTNGSAAAENLRASVSPSPESLTSTSWVANGPGSIRRGGLDAAVSSTLTLQFPGMASAGPATLSATVVSDGSGSQVFNFPITVLPSFQSWAAGLVDGSVTGDSDQDGIPNLLEYAFGGDNQVASQALAGTSTPLLPVIVDGTSLTFTRRTDSVQRGLNYVVQFNDSLEGNGWQTLSSPTPVVVSQPIAGFERVSVALSGVPAGRRFFRLGIELAE